MLTGAQFAQGWSIVVVFSALGRTPICKVRDIDVPLSKGDFYLVSGTEGLDGHLDVRFPVRSIGQLCQISCSSDRELYERITSFAQKYRLPRCELISFL
jgi:hypothetical protein